MLAQTDAIQSELERILSSKEFVASPRLVRFLRYCVEQSREGRVESLKESVIGVHVFDRAASYDPKVDPIVRVHARRLREKLDAFYVSEGALDIVIQIPKGGYVARFAEVPLSVSNELPPPVLAVTELAAPQRRTLGPTLWMVAAVLTVFAAASLLTLVRGMMFSSEVVSSEQAVHAGDPVTPGQFELVQGVVGSA